MQSGPRQRRSTTPPVGAADIRIGMYVVLAGLAHLGLPDDVARVVADHGGGLWLVPLQNPASASAFTADLLVETKNIFLCQRTLKCHNCQGVGHTRAHCNHDPEPAAAPSAANIAGGHKSRATVLAAAAAAAAVEIEGLKKQKEKDKKQCVRKLSALSQDVDVLQGTLETRTLQQSTRTTTRKRPSCTQQK